MQSLSLLSGGLQGRLDKVTEEELAKRLLNVQKQHLAQKAPKLQVVGW